MKKPRQVYPSTMSHSWTGVQSAVVAGVWQIRQGPSPVVTITDSSVPGVWVVAMR